MAVKVASNATSLLVQRSLASATEKLSKANERLSSGQRINHASDDAAGLAISSQLNAAAKVFAQALRNVNDGASFLNIAEGALAALTNITTREMELAEQSANGTYSLQQRRAMDSEASALVNEFNRIVQSTGFNGRAVLDLSQTGSDLRIQAGYGKDGSLSVQVGDALGRNVGTGDFTLHASLLSNGGYGYAGTEAVVLGDVNGDGTLDLVAGGGYSYLGYSNGEVKVFFNSGGEFTLQTTISSNGGTHRGITDSVVLGDVNGDGSLDLISAGYAQDYGGTARGEVRIYVNDGKGHFALQTTITSNFGTSFGKSYSVVAADVNGDGSLDILSGGVAASGGLGQGQTKVFLNDGRGNFALRSTVTSNYWTGGSDTDSISVGDVNGDGSLDMISGGRVTDGVFYHGETRIFLNDGSGQFSLKTAITSNGGGAYASTHSVALSDLNSDGYLDMLAAGKDNSSGVTRLYLNNGSGNFSLQAMLTTNTSAALDGETRSLAMADINGDGYLDLLAGGHGTSAGQTTIFFNDGRGNFSLQTALTSNKRSSDSWTMSLAVGDVNGDGVCDVIGGGGNYDYVGEAMVLFGKAVKTTTAAHINLLSRESARRALTDLQAQLTRISSEMGSMGGFQSRLQTEIGNLGSLRENYLSAASRIMDIDVASESAEFVRQQILQETASAILAQANQEPMIAIQLLSPGSAPAGLNP